MSIWRTTTIHQTPEIELASWRVFEVSSERWPDKSRHLVGYNLTERAGRVSSAIQSFDSERMVVTTGSGRTYFLSGEPGSGSQDGLYTWNRWCEINMITVTNDVTSEYIKEKK